VRFFPMTPDDRNHDQPASLSLSQVYRLIALEQVEMDKRVAERRALSVGRIGDASNVIHLKARANRNFEIEAKRPPLRRSAG
jgi:hypothetical protein